MYNVLICDDERDIVEALKIYLSGEGYSLFAAYDGREALEIAAAAREGRMPSFMSPQLETEAPAQMPRG